ncbi:lymphoid-specific helicase-like [Anoplophora glabripennis]|uniref:lymphoid-specific helicase-like n=1 Tax=Anoplophora glabripennis TaxID=217634 RepID=UPI00087555C8|nr:lymphoid-specific helicase-like [Anoplophora glabripennis]
MASDMDSVVISDESLDLNSSKNKNIDTNREEVENFEQSLLSASNGLILNTTEDLELRRELEREYKKQLRVEAKKLAEEESLKQRREKALKGMKYLLGVSEKYSEFFQEKVFSEDVKKKPLQERNKFQPTVEDMKDAVKMKSKKSGGKKYADVSKFLKFFEGGSLRPYQIDGVTWMTVLFENGLNGILADEMGLGKTIQVIALICHLLQRKTHGPYLIVGPLSTLPNWQAEFEKFAPQVPVVLFHGSQQERLMQYRMIKKRYEIGGFLTQPVILTSYQIPLLEYNFLRQFDWQYVIIDEGHRLKNHESKLSKILRSLNSSNRLLLTGTPLQNNITELWALLNFLLPHVFNNMDTFASLLMVEDVQDENKLLEQEEKTNLISTIHRVLGPFMLRRLKKDVLTDMVPKKEVTVFCPLSKLQRDLYSYVISKNLSKLLRKDEEEISYVVDAPRKKRKCVVNRTSYCEIIDEDDDSDFEGQLITEEETRIGQKIEKKALPYITRLTMTNPMMMFKKIVDHPFLIHFPLDPNSEEKALLVDENIVEASGKMMVLDTMLPILKKKGHKVLIFSTLVMSLDFIEELMILRGHSYRRLDGSQRLENRGKIISEFNSDPDIFAFLISTRAGGLGLNLTGADTVIFFDSDWNPQADIQAQDRCHRIGQTRPVMVYTLVTKNTIDEKIITRGQQKRMLEKIVIKDGKFKINQQDRVIVENELKDLQKLLEQENNNSSNGYVFSKEELNKLLDRSDLYEIMRKKNGVK